MSNPCSPAQLVMANRIMEMKYNAAILLMLTSIDNAPNVHRSLLDTHLNQQYPIWPNQTHGRQQSLDSCVGLTSWLR